MRAWVRLAGNIAAPLACLASWPLAPSVALADEDEYVAGCAWYVHGEVYDPPRPAQRVGVVSGRGNTPEEAKDDVVAAAAGMQHYADQPCKLYGPVPRAEADEVVEELREMGAGDAWPDDSPSSDLELGS